MNRFCTFNTLRNSKEIDADIKDAEKEIIRLLRKVTTI